MDTVRFSDFVLHRRVHRLTRASKDVPIGSRALDLLELLLIHSDRVVSRDEIMQAVWPGTVVGDNNLNVQVANLRRLLGAGAIATVSGRGLRFALEVTSEERPGLASRPALGGCAAFFELRRRP